MVDWLLILRLNPGFKWRLFVIMGWVWRNVFRCFELSDYALYVAAKDKQAPSLEQVLTHSTTHPPPPTHTPHAATTTITKNLRIALVEEVLLRGDRVFLAF